MIFLSHYLNWDELVFDSLSNTAEASAPRPLHPPNLAVLTKRWNYFCLVFFRHFSTGTHLCNLEKVLDGDVMTHSEMFWTRLTDTVFISAYQFIPTQTRRWGTPESVNAPSFRPHTPFLWWEGGREREERLGGCRVSDYGTTVTSKFPAWVWVGSVAFDRLTHRAAGSSW